MIVIVDTNIVFSAILNTESIIGDLILNSNEIFQFWSCHYLLQEIDKHWNKLRKISKLDDADLYESKQLIYKVIHFIDEEQIPKSHRLRAFDLVKDIDIKDIAFVALNEYQKSVLWTGDKVLTNVLKFIGYERVVTTNEMVRLRDRLENERV